MPKTIGCLVEEMICSANVSFSLYPGLTHGAYTAIHAHGGEELKAKFLPKMVDGTWSGSMCLTEAHCGTDLGLLRTKAEPQADGTYKLTGSKIFISSGEHDLTENIIHLVLARLPDAPKGVKGISLFLVPKFLVKEDGSVGPRNGVACGAIEHKMGIKASATCVINFDAAEGLSRRRAAQGHARHVHDDEHGASGRRRAGAGRGGDVVSERRDLCARASARPVAHGDEAPR